MDNIKLRKLQQELKDKNKGGFTSFFMLPEEYQSYRKLKGGFFRGGGLL